MDDLGIPPFLRNTHIEGEKYPDTTNTTQKIGDMSRKHTSAWFNIVNLEMVRFPQKLTRFIVMKVLACRKNANCLPPKALPPLLSMVNLTTERHPNPASTTGSLRTFTLPSWPWGRKLFTAFGPVLATAQPSAIRPREASIDGKQPSWDMLEETPQHCNKRGSAHLLHDHLHQVPKRNDPTIATTKNPAIQWIQLH